MLANAICAVTDLLYRLAASGAPTPPELCESTGSDGVHRKMSELPIFTADAAIADLQDVLDELNAAALKSELMAERCGLIDVQHIVDRAEAGQPFDGAAVSRIADGYFAIWKKVAATVSDDRPATPPTKQPLGRLASLIYEKLITLPEHKAMTLPAILDWLSKEHRELPSEDTFHKRIKPELDAYGLQSRPKVGYFIPAFARPTK